LTRGDRPLRILIVSHYFWPESFRVNDLAAGLRARGHRVDVLTGVPNYPDGKWFPGYGPRGPRNETHDGIAIHRVPIVSRGASGGARLAVNYASFVLSAGAMGPFVTPREIDVILVFAPSPLTVALPALWLRALRGAPVVLWVQDLWPEALIAVGAVRNRFLLRAVGRLVSWIYRRCDLVLGQSEAVVDAVRARGGDPRRVHYFPCSTEDIYLAEPPEGSRGRLEAEGVPPGFRVLFAGNIGAAQGLEVLLDAAERLRGRADLRWVILGDGSRRAWLMSEVARRQLESHVYFIERHPISEMPAFFADADALLVTLRSVPGLSATIPSKIQSYLASGRPILAALDGEGARVVREAGAGIACPGGDAAALALAAATLADLGERERAAMGQRGRRYYDAHFDQERLLDRLEGWLRALRAPSADAQPQARRSR
jgi:glycosyltransferase involved in cell wall biosynthesis